MKTVPSNPAVIKFGPPRTATRKEIPTPAVSKSGVTQSDAFTSAAVGPPNIESGVKIMSKKKGICDVFLGRACQSL